MPDTNTNVQGTGNTNNGVTTPTLNLDEAMKVLKETRSEAASRRVENKELSNKIAELQANIEAEKQAKLEEQGKYKEIAEAQKAELEKLKIDLASKTEIVEKHNAERKAMADDILSKLDDENKDWLKDEDTEHIIKFGSALLKQNTGITAPANGKQKQGFKQDISKLSASDKMLLSRK